MTHLTHANGAPVVENLNIETAGARVSSDERQRLFDDTAGSLGGASEEVRQRHVRDCSMADPGYGAGVAAALKRLDS